MMAGKFRDRITIERQAEVSDGYGNNRGEWSTHLRVWANFMAQQGREQLSQEIPQSTSHAVCLVRNSEQNRTILASDRVVHRGQVWNIRSRPTITGKRRDLIEFTLEAGVAT